MTLEALVAGEVDWSIEHTEALALLARLPDQSISSIVTDPPYGIGFMNREWDTFAPEAVARRTARKARKTTIAPPRHGRVQSGGWIEYDQSPEGRRRFQVWVEAWARECRRVLVPGGYLVAFGSPRTYHRLACGLEDAGLELRDTLMWVHGQGFPKSLDLGKVLGPDWAGWGSALKPGYEPIALCRAPLAGRSLTANVAAHGAGGLHIDACRVGPAPGRWPTNLLLTHDPNCARVGERRVRGDRHHPARRGRSTWSPTGFLGQETLSERRDTEESVDRWRCAPGCPVAEMDAQSGRLRSGANPTRRHADKFGVTYGAFVGQEDVEPLRGLDTGGAARFFATFAYDLEDDWPAFLYCAKATRAERDFALDDAPTRTMHRVNPGGLEHDPRWAPTRVKNAHPTVKPEKMMRYLACLVTPPGGLLLDLFVGSGTTGVAALRAGFRFLGCEREAEHADTARRRVSGHLGPMFRTGP